MRNLQFRKTQEPRPRSQPFHVEPRQSQLLQSLPATDTFSCVQRKATGDGQNEKQTGRLPEGPQACCKRPDSKDLVGFRGTQSLLAPPSAALVRRHHDSIWGSQAAREQHMLLTRGPHPCQSQQIGRSSPSRTEKMGAMWGEEKKKAVLSRAWLRKA